MRRPPDAGGRRKGGVGGWGLGGTWHGGWWGVVGLYRRTGPSLPNHCEVGGDSLSLNEGRETLEKERMKSLSALQKEEGEKEDRQLWLQLAGLCTFSLFLHIVHLFYYACVHINETLHSVQHQVPAASLCSNHFFSSLLTCTKQSKTKQTESLNFLHMLLLLVGSCHR